MQPEPTPVPVSPDDGELPRFCLARSGLELRGSHLVRTTRSGQVVEHRLERVSELTFGMGNNLAVPGIGLVLLGVAILVFIVVPVRWIAWTVLVATIAFVSFAMLGMRTPFLIFYEDGVRFRYLLIGPDDEVAAFELGIRRVVHGSDV